MRSTKVPSKTKAAAVLSAAAAMLAVADASPAFASGTQLLRDTAHCRVWTGGNCTTNAIPANAHDHHLYYSVAGGVTGGCNYRIRDINNDVVVRSGRVGIGEQHDTLYGLYGWYRLELRSCAWGSQGKIEN